MIVLLLVLFAFLGLAADDDADEGSIEDIRKIRLRNGTDANPEMQDFVGGVYEGKAGSYWISGNNIFTPDGECIRRVGNNYFTPEGNYRKVGNTYFKPDGAGAVVRSGNTFSGDGSATIKSGANYFQDGTISRAVGNAVFKTDSEDDAKGKVQLRRP